MPKLFVDGIEVEVKQGATGMDATNKLGGYVPLNERYDKKYPEHGMSSTGVVFGVREDLDEVNYFTVFVGYAIFILPGY